jgi:hypothetical protein
MPAMHRRMVLVLHALVIFCLLVGVLSPCRAAERSLLQQVNDINQVEVHQEEDNNNNNNNSPPRFDCGNLVLGCVNLGAEQTPSSYLALTTITGLTEEEVCMQPTYREREKQAVSYRRFIHVHA